MNAEILSTLRGLVAPAALTLTVLALPAGPARAQANQPIQYQTADIVDFETLVPLGGAATLFRTANSLTARVATSELDPGAAYTVWWVVWNRPELCSAPCDEDDLGIPGNSVFYAAGFVTDLDGVANVEASVGAGHLPQGIDVLIPGGLRPGNGFKAVVHLVVRSHGPIIPGSVAEQIGTFLGGCGINTCTDQQAAVFEPVG